jgi:hypothetical protein
MKPDGCLVEPKLVAFWITIIKCCVLTVYIMQIKLYNFNSTFVVNNMYGGQKYFNETGIKCSEMVQNCLLYTSLSPKK